MSKLRWFITPTGICVTLLIFWLYSSPRGAAHLAHRGLGVLAHGGHSLQTFLSAL